MGEREECRQKEQKDIWFDIAKYSKINFCQIILFRHSHQS